MSRIMSLLKDAFEKRELFMPYHTNLLTDFVPKSLEIQYRTYESLVHDSVNFPVRYKFVEVPHRKCCACPVYHLLLDGELIKEYCACRCGYSFERSKKRGETGEEMEFVLVDCLEERYKECRAPNEDPKWFDQQLDLPFSFNCLYPCFCDECKDKNMRQVTNWLINKEYTIKGSQRSMIYRALLQIYIDAEGICKTIVEYARWPEKEGICILCNRNLMFKGSKTSYVCYGSCCGKPGVGEDVCMDCAHPVVRKCQWSFCEMAGSCQCYINEPKNLKNQNMNASTFPTGRNVRPRLM